MPKYLVRANCEYSMAVEADSEDEALEIACRTRLNEWDQAWSPDEVELCEEDEINR